MSKVKRGKKRGKKSTIIIPKTKNIDLRDSDSNDSEKCRYCLENTEETDLFRPCRCTALVHRGCLDRWLEDKPTPHHCPECKFTFVVEHRRTVNIKPRTIKNCLTICQENLPPYQGCCNRVTFWQIYFCILHIALYQGIRWDSLFGFKVALDIDPNFEGTNNVYTGILLSFLVTITCVVIFWILVFFGITFNWIVKRVQLETDTGTVEYHHTSPTSPILFSLDHEKHCYQCVPFNTMEITYYKYCGPFTLSVFLVIAYTLLHGVGLLYIEYYLIPDAGENIIDIPLLHYPSAFSATMGVFVILFPILILILICICILSVGIIFAAIYYGLKKCFCVVEEHTVKELRVWGEA